MTLSVSGGGLFGLLSLDLLSALLELCLSLETHDTSTPFALWIVVELGLEVVGEDSELVFVFLVDFRKSDNGGILLVRECPKSCLTLDDAERDVHLTA